MKTIINAICEGLNAHTNETRFGATFTTIIKRYSDPVLLNELKNKYGVTMYNNYFLDCHGNEIAKVLPAFTGNVGANYINEFFVVFI